MNGVQVEMIVRTKSARSAAGASGAAGMPPMSDARKAQFAQARAQLEQMAKCGVPEAATVQQQLARARGGALAPANSNTPSDVMVETTSDSTGFSTSNIPDSAFQIPADYNNDPVVSGYKVQ